jgi:phage terminase small subunit
MKTITLNSNKLNEMTLPVAKKILPVDLVDLNLDLKEYKFVAVYCTNGFSGPEAAKEAGYRGDRKTLQSQAWSLLKRPNILEAVKRFINSVIEPYKAKLEYEILDRYYKRATYSIDTFFDENGDIKPLDEIDPEWLCVIDGVEKKYFGGQAQRSTVTYQLPNRDLALQMLYRIATGQDPNDAGKNMMPQEARNRLSQIFNAVLPSSKTGAETPVTTTTRMTIEQVTQTFKEPGRPRKYCKLVKGQACVHCGRCREENHMVDVTPAPVSPKVKLDMNKRRGINEL